jgi:hypothetical protein
MLNGAPHVSGRAAHALAAGVSQGGGARAGLAALPASARPVAAHAVRASFVAGLNEIFLVGAVLTLVASVLTLILIRGKDFEAGAARGPQTSSPPGEAVTPTGDGSVHRTPAAGATAVAAERRP